MIWFILAVALIIFVAGFLTGWLVTLREGWFCWPQGQASDETISHGAWVRRYLRRFDR